MSSTLGIDTDQTAVLSGLDPRRTALVGIHWQRGIVHPGGFFGERFSEPLRRSGGVARTTALVNEARTAGVTIVQVKICNPPDLITNNPLFKHALESGSLACGHPDVELIDEMAPSGSDLVITHHRASAFAGTELAAHLRHRRIDTVVLTGISTHVAVEGTAREGIDMGLDVLLLSDCCVAPSEAVHEDAVERMQLLLTQVATAEELLTAIRGAGPQVPEATGGLPR